MVEDAEGHREVVVEAEGAEEGEEVPVVEVVGWGGGRWDRVMTELGGKNGRGGGGGGERDC